MTADDPAIARMRARAQAAWDAAECRDCKTAIHDGDTCIECWRDRRELGLARDREWWSA